MSKLYNYLYITTNLVNNKQYVGEHSTNNLDDNYFGSGYLLFKSIKKYGILNFKKEILVFCNSKKEAFDLQEEYIIKYNTLNPNGYNISPKGGHNVKNCISQETKDKIGKANKGNQTWLGKHHTLESKIKIGQKEIGNTKFKGKQHSIESKLKISNALKGKPSWNKNKKLSELHKEHLRKPKSELHKEHLRKPKSEEGRANIRAAANTPEYKERMSKIQKGKIVSAETRLKMSINAKNRKPISDETRLKMSKSQTKRFSKNK